MEELTVVSFEVDADKWSKKNRFSDWQYWITEAGEDGKPEDIHFMQVCLPGSFRRKKAWTRVLFDEYLAGMANLPLESRYVYYLPSGEAQKLMGRKTEPISYEWTELLITRYVGQFNSLVILEDRDMEADRIVKKYVKDTKYLAVATAAPGSWENITEEISEEYGFLLNVADTVKRLHLSDKGRTLFIAGAELHGCVPATLPHGSVWLTTQIGETEGRRLCSHAQQVTYISMMKLVGELKK